MLETVKKLRWSPDIIHCHGWFTSLIPLYIKKSYKDDPLFQDSKVIYSAYDDDFEGYLESGFRKKLKIEGVAAEDTRIISDANYVNLSKLAINFSDGIVFGSEKINKDVEDYIKISKKPVLDYKSEEEYIDAYSDFYNRFL